MKPWTHHHIPKPGQSHVTQTVAAHHSTCVSCIMLDSQVVLHCLVFCCIPTLVPMHPPISWPVSDLCSRWHWREPWFKTSPSSQWLSVNQITTLAGLRGPAADTNRPGCLCPINFLPHSFTLFSACQRGLEVPDGHRKVTSEVISLSCFRAWDDDIKWKILNYQMFLQFK